MNKSSQLVGQYVIWMISCVFIETYTNCCTLVVTLIVWSIQNELVVFHYYDFLVRVDLYSFTLIMVNQNRKEKASDGNEAQKTSV